MTASEVAAGIAGVLSELTTDRATLVKLSTTFESVVLLDGARVRVGAFVRADGLRGLSIYTAKGERFNLLVEKVQP
jgi:hypothetical protein